MDSRRDLSGSPSCASGKISAAPSANSPRKDRALRRQGRRALLKDESIISSRAKIDAAIGGARLWLDIMEKEASGFSGMIWKFADPPSRMNRFKRMQDIPAKTEMSEKLSKELKGRGFKFCGPVIVYAFAQAVGMVNDHIVACHRYQPCAKLAAQAAAAVRLHFHIR
jgi:DNA-3-methyladenine glycosylase I